MLKSQNTCTIYSIWMSVPNVLYRQLLVKIKEKLMIYVVWLSVLCFIQCLFVFLWQIATFYSTVSFCFVSILTEKRKKADNNLIKRQKYGSINSPRCPALWFVNILKLGKEEWVLVQLGSQQKHVEQPVWPVFPDYLSVSCDYK